MEPDSDQWIKALEKEYNDLMRNHTWKFVERPNGKKILFSKWVFVRKRDAHGHVVSHRTRITVGRTASYYQTYGVFSKYAARDYGRRTTFSLGQIC